MSAFLLEALASVLSCFSQFLEVPCSLACGSFLPLPSQWLRIFAPVCPPACLS